MEKHYTLAKSAASDTEIKRMQRNARIIVKPTAVALER